MSRSSQNNLSTEKLDKVPLISVVSGDRPLPAAGSKSGLAQEESDDLQQIRHRQGAVPVVKCVLVQAVKLES